MVFGSMSGRHAINLSTAWCPPPATGSPAAWLRRFGRPAGIERGDSVWLVIESPGGCRASLNGAEVPPVRPGGVVRHEVTRLLLPRNELRLDPSVSFGLQSADDEQLLPTEEASRGVPGDPQRLGSSPKREQDGESFFHPQLEPLPAPARCPLPSEVGRAWLEIESGRANRDESA
jgi:hypothetical protein